METSQGKGNAETYSWRLEPESKPILKELNLRSFRKRQNIYLAVAALIPPIAFYMSYFEFQESLSTSIYGALGIGVLLIFLWLVLLLVLRTKALFPESMHLSVYESGIIVLKVDNNSPIEIKSWTKAGQTAGNTIIQVDISGVQCFVPFPTNIYEKVSRL